jgi:hypothetical protein
MPIWMFHGAEGEVVDIAETNRMAGLLDEGGLNTVFRCLKDITLVRF